MDQIQESNEAPNMFQRTLKMAAYPIAAVTGLFYGHSAVRDKSYNNMKSGGAFNTERKIRSEQISREAPPSGTTKDMKGIIAEADQVYSRAVDKRFAEYGYNNMLDRFKSLHRNQKMDTVMHAITATAVSLGVVLTIADSKSLFKRLSGQDRKSDETSTPSKG